MIHGLSLFGVTYLATARQLATFGDQRLQLIAGTMQAIMLPMIGFAVLYFRYKRCDKRLEPSKTWDLFLWLSFAGFLLVGAYQTYDKLFK